MAAIKDLLQQIMHQRLYRALISYGLMNTGQPSMANTIYIIIRLLLAGH